MTGMEAWSLVSPILAQYCYAKPGDGLDKMNDAYVLIFGALKEYDERRTKVKKDE